MKWLTTKTFSWLDVFFILIVVSLCLSYSWWWMLLNIPLSLASVLLEMKYHPEYFNKDSSNEKED